MTTISEVQDPVKPLNIRGFYGNSFVIRLTVMGTSPMPTEVDSVAYFDGGTALLQPELQPTVSVAGRVIMITYPASNGYPQMGFHRILIDGRTVLAGRLKFVPFVVGSPIPETNLTITITDAVNVAVNIVPPGLKGDQGEKGDQGIQGIQGIQGSKGDQGIQGIQGPKGDQGIQGIQGPKGDQGIQGIQGPKGDQGEKGDQGIQGIQGLKGDQGQAAPSYTDRHDLDALVSYYGIALSGSSETSPVWTITRVQSSLNGTTVTTKATLVAWSNRKTTTYS